VSEHYWQKRRERISHGKGGKIGFEKIDIMAETIFSERDKKAKKSKRHVLNKKEFRERLQEDLKK